MWINQKRVNNWQGFCLNMFLLVLRAWMVFIGPKEMFLAAKILERQFDSRSHITIGKTKKERKHRCMWESRAHLLSFYDRWCPVTSDLVHTEGLHWFQPYYLDRGSESVSLASILENRSRTHLIAPRLSLKHSFKGPVTRNTYVCIFLWSLPSNLWKYTCLVWIPDTGVTCERRTQLYCIDPTDLKCQWRHVTTDGSEQVKSLLD